MTDNKFVLVLVDGDPIPFQDQFYRDGDEGGSRLGSQIRTSVQAHLKDQEDHSSKMSIIVKMFASSPGVATILRDRGIIRQISDFDRFTEGFTSTPLSEFVNVGQRKEVADKKIIGMAT